MQSRARGPWLLYAGLFTLLAPSAQAADNNVVENLRKKNVRVHVDKKTGAVVSLSMNHNCNDITLDDYKTIGTLTSLKSIGLAANKMRLNDEAAKYIGQLESVERLTSNVIQLSDDGFQAFAGMKNLKHFGMDHWFGPPGLDRKSYVGKGVAHLKVLPKLESIRMGGCRVDNQVCQALTEIKTLKRIDLFHTFRVTDDGVALLKKLPNLQYLRLAPQFTTRITDKSLEYIGDMPSIEEIMISETLLTYKNGYAHLKKLKNLKKITLQKVLSDKEEIEKLKRDHPKATIEWTLPPEEVIPKLKKKFEATLS